MDWRRWFRHLFSTRGELHRAFPPSTLGAIETAITETERMHSGEVRFAIEASLEPSEIWRGRTPRERALRVFAALGVWDTDANNGVLIYVLLADRDVEIVADRGIDAKVGAAGWEKICKSMETDFKAGNFAGGVVKGIQAVSQQLAAHFPRQGKGPNELPDKPVVV